MANPPLTFTITGFAPGEDIGSSDVVGTPTCTTTARTTSHAGSYPITCAKGSLVSVHYTFVFVKGTLTVA